MGQNQTLSSLYSHWAGTKTLTHIKGMKLGILGRGDAKWMKTRPPQRWYFVPWRSTESIDWFQNPDSPSSLPVCCLLTFHLGPGLVACRPGLSTNSPAWYGGNDQIKPFLNTRTLSDSIMLGSTSVLKSEILVTQWWEKERPTKQSKKKTCSSHASHTATLRVANFQLAPQFDERLQIAGSQFQNRHAAILNTKGEARFSGIRSCSCFFIQT